MKHSNAQQRNGPALKWWFCFSTLQIQVEEEATTDPVKTRSFRVLQQEGDEFQRADDVTKKDSTRTDQGTLGMEKMKHRILRVTLRKCDQVQHSDDVKKKGSTETQPPLVELTDHLTLEKKKPRLSRKICFICLAAFASVEAANDHLKANHQDVDGRYICPLPGCSLSLVSRDACRYHINMHSQKTRHKCIACEVVFDDLRTLKNHMKASHQDAQGRYICFIPGCSWSHLDRGQYRSHMTNHSKSVCQFCGKLYARYDLTKHILLRHKEKRFTCDLCGFRTSAKTDLQKHITVTHSDERRFSCAVCRMMFKDKKGLKLHSVTHNTEPPFRCSDCGRGFNKESLYTQHKGTHLGIFPFECSICGKKFLHNAAMKLHRLKHSSVIKFGHSARSPAISDLQKHTIPVHSDERPFLCGVCGKLFKDKKGLNQHSVIHSAEPPFKCPDCGRGFNRETNIAQHRRLHLGTGIFPFECTICGEKFRHNATMKHHRLNHASVIKFGHSAVSE